MRISDWSSDVCSSDLDAEEEAEAEPEPEEDAAPESDAADGDRREDDADDAAPSIDVVPGNEDESEEPGDAQAGGQKDEGGEPTPGSDEESFEIGRATGRGRVCQCVYISVVVVSLKQKKT